MTYVSPEMAMQRLEQTYDHYVLAPAYGCAGLNEWDPEAVHQRRYG